MNFIRWIAKGWLNIDWRVVISISLEVLGLIIGILGASLAFTVGVISGPVGLWFLLSIPVGILIGLWGRYLEEH